MESKDGQRKKKEKSRMKVGFKDLDGFMKTTIVLAWITIGISIIGFLVGFIAGSLGY